MTDINDLRTEIIDLLTEVEEYMDDRADAECFADSPQPVGNAEMRLFTQARDILNRLGVPCVARP